MLAIRMHELRSGSRFFAEIRQGADIFFHRAIIIIRYIISVWIVIEAKKIMQFTRKSIVDIIFSAKHFVVYWWDKFEVYLIGKGHVKQPSAVSFFWKTMAEYKAKHGTTSKNTTETRPETSIDEIQKIEDTDNDVVSGS